MVQKSHSLGRIGLVFAALLVALGLVLGSAERASAAGEVLYAATGSGPTSGCSGTAASLYTVNTGTGALTLVGPIKIGTTQVNHVTGLAFDPTTGTLYGYMNGQQSNCSDFAHGTLLTIDKTTGAATVVGSQGLSAVQSPDMTFDPFGQAYLWAECDFSCNPIREDLMTANKATGTSALVGECGCSAYSAGIAFDSLGRMYLKARNNPAILARVNPFTGHVFGQVTLDANASNILAFGPGDVLWTGRRGSAGPSAFTLMTIDPSTGVTTTIGTSTVTNVSALAWDMGTPTAPDVSDLSLTKNVDDSSPDNWGDQVVYTLTISNDGPKDATGVVVTDPLPSGVSYVSDDGGGAYDSTTGLWTVGPLTNGNSATLHITATAQPTASWENDAEVTASDQYDSDSVPGSGEGDTFASSTLTPTADPNVDVAVSVDPKGRTVAKGKKKAFDVIVANVGAVEVTVSSTDLDVQVNSSTDTVFCKLKTLKIKPGKQKRFNCSFSPRLTGITPGQGVTYQATVNLPADGFSGNDTNSAIVIAK